MNSVHPEGQKCRAVLLNRYRRSSFRAERSAAEWSRSVVWRHTTPHGGISPVVFLVKVEIPRPFDTPAGRRAGFPSVARNDANW